MEAQTRLQTNMELEKKEQLAAMKAKYEKKKQKKLEERKRKEEEKMKKAGDVFTKAMDSGPEAKEEGEGEHRLGALVLSRFQRHSIRSVSIESPSNKAKERAGERATLGVSIPVGSPRNAAEGQIMSPQMKSPSGRATVGVSWDTWTEALMRSPLFTRIQQIEDMVKQNTKMLLDMAAASKQKYRDPNDQDVPNEGRLVRPFCPLPEGSHECKE